MTCNIQVQIFIDAYAYMQATLSAVTHFDMLTS